MPDIFDNWIVRIHNNLKINGESVNSKDYVFFNVEMIEKAARHTVKFIKSCQTCQQNKDELLALSEQFPQMLDTISGRRQFTNRLDKVLKHLRKEHGIYPKGYFTGLYTMVGVLAGFAVSLIVTGLKILSFFSSMLIFLGLGTIIGWVWGLIKDGKIARSQKQL